MSKEFDINEFDITAKIGPTSHRNASWPMHSFERPSWLLWNAIAKNLHSKGWADNAIKEWLQSKETRWALDGELGEALEALGAAWADKNVR
jgi:predicted transcriptional regulator